MEPYFRIERPARQTLPLVVDVPHSGEWIPDDVRAQMVIGEQVLRRDLDLYVDRLWGAAPQQGATLVVSKVSRYVVDLNRAPDDVSPLTVEGGRRVEKPGYYHDRGVVWRATTDGIAVMAEPMSAEAFQDRMARFYLPYHEALAQEIARVKRQFGICIVIDGHSMPSRGRAGHTDTGLARAEIVPGDVDGASCDTTVRWLVEEHFRGRGYSVRSNNPYKGGHITRHYGRPQEGIHAIQIEARRDLYMNEKTFRVREDGFQRLQKAFHDLVPQMGELDLPKVRHYS